MANEVKSVKDSGKAKKYSNSQLLTGVIAFGSAFLLIAAIIFGTFYFIIHSNFNGIGDKYRDNIVKIPIMRHALPEAKDNEDLSQLTNSELINRCNELKKSNEELKQANEELNKKYSTKNDETNSSDEEIQTLTRQLEDAKNKNSELDKSIKQSEEYVRKANELLALGNKADFKQYYEKLDKDTAQKIYAEIIQEQKITEEAKKFIQIYETIDPAVTAKIFEEMGTNQIELIVLILKNMKKDISAEIIAGMQTTFSAKVTDKLSVLIKP